MRLASLLPQSDMPLASVTIKDENGACLHRLCLSFLPLSVIPAKAGIQRLIDIYCRLHGNDKKVEFVQTYQCPIYVAMIHTIG
jgi:hypothetical protein